MHLQTWLRTSSPLLGTPLPSSFAKSSLIMSASSLSMCTFAEHLKRTDTGAREIPQWLRAVEKNVVTKRITEDKWYPSLCPRSRGINPRNRHWPRRGRRSRGEFFFFLNKRIHHGFPHPPQGWLKNAYQDSEMFFLGLWRAVGNWLGRWEVVLHIRISLATAGLKPRDNFSFLSLDDMSQWFET